MYQCVQCRRVFDAGSLHLTNDNRHACSLSCKALWDEELMWPLRGTSGAASTSWGQTSWVVSSDAVELERTVFAVSGVCIESDGVWYDSEGNAVDPPKYQRFGVGWNDAAKLENIGEEEDSD